MRPRDRAVCTACRKERALRLDGVFPIHTDPRTRGERCRGSERTPYEVTVQEITTATAHAIVSPPPPPAFDPTPPSANDRTAAQVAFLFGCGRRKVTDEATRHAIGYNLGGRAGYRFTPADVDKLRRAMAPAPAVEPRRTA